MALKDILKLVTQVPVASEARPATIVAPTALSQAAEKLVSDSRQTGLMRLSPEQTKQMGVTSVSADPDRSKVLLAAAALLKAEPDFARRYGLDPAMPGELMATEHGAQRLQGSYQLWGTAARRGILLLGADLTTRVEKLDDALAAILAEGKGPVSILLLPEKMERAKGADAAQARADRTRARHALTQGLLNEEARQAMLVRATDRFTHLPELPETPQTGE